MTVATGQGDDRLVGGGWRTSPTPELSPILSASLDAFSEHGYHGTTVRDIAKRVGVTVPALYYHHENKEGLLFALLDTGIEHYNTRRRHSAVGGLHRSAAWHQPDGRVHLGR